MDSKRGRHGREEEYMYRTVFVDMKERVISENRNIDGRVIFEWIVKKHY